MGREYNVQKAVADYLKARGVHFTHVANERNTNPARGNKLKKMGVKRGIPDILIFEKPPALEDHYCGVALELKAEDRYMSDVTDSQEEQIHKFRGSGFKSGVAFGTDEAIDFLQSIGF